MAPRREWPSRTANPDPAGADLTEPRRALAQKWADLLTGDASEQAAALVAVRRR
jgi:hypothetical protein